MKTLSDFYRLFPNRPALAEQPVPTAVVRTMEAAPAPAPARTAPRYRKRGPGTGYGGSSGYAMDSRYAAPHDGRLLRVC